MSPRAFQQKKIGNGLLKEIGVQARNLKGLTLVCEACRSLGIGESALRRWVDQVQKEHKGVTPHSKALTPGQQKIQELEARIARLEREKSIPKKSTALLISEDHERSR